MDDRARDAGRLRGLYAIADSATIEAPAFAEAVAAALAGGAALVQYRDKGDDGDRRRREAATIVHLCRERGALAIVNDDPGLALAVGAHGVHLGRDDADPAAVRARLGADAVIGVSCYDDIERARRAAAAGADYVAFGSVYPSPTKPDAVHAPLALLGAARTELGLPVCAIGGITADRAPELVAAGADLLAVIGDLFTRADITARARCYARAFARAAR